MANEQKPERGVIESPKLTPERGPTDKGKRQFDVGTSTALMQRIEQAKLDGAVNISVSIDFLLELLTGCRHAMQDAKWQSKMEV